MILRMAQTDWNFAKAQPIVFPKNAPELWDPITYVVRSNLQNATKLTSVTGPCPTGCGHGNVCQFGDHAFACCKLPHATRIHNSIRKKKMEMYRKVGFETYSQDDVNGKHVCDRLVAPTMPGFQWKPCDIVRPKMQPLAVAEDLTFPWAGEKSEYEKLVHRFDEDGAPGGGRAVAAAAELKKVYNYYKR